MKRIISVLVLCLGLVLVIGLSSLLNSRDQVNNNEVAESVEVSANTDGYLYTITDVSNGEIYGNTISNVSVKYDEHDDIVNVSIVE